jgi:hypothetical protein
MALVLRFGRPSMPGKGKRFGRQRVAFEAAKGAQVTWRFL